MRRPLAALTTLTAAAALALAAPAAAHADDHSHSHGRSDLVLSWTSLYTGERHAVTLECDWWPSGSHPTPWDACHDLRRAGGDPDRIRPDWGPCTLEYAPVRASIRGTWEGDRVHWSEFFSNRCVMERETSDVMAFD